MSFYVCHVSNMFKALLFHHTLKDFKGPVNPGINGLGHVVLFLSFQGILHHFKKQHSYRVFRVTISPLRRCNLPHAALKIQFWKKKKQPLWDIRLSMFCQLAFNLLRLSRVAVFVAVVPCGLLPKCRCISWNYCKNVVVWHEVKSQNSRHVREDFIIR